MTLFLVYPGKRGSNLECALALYSIAKELGADTKLILSADNERKQKVAQLYPEVEFHNFFSPSDMLGLKKIMKDQTALFTMYSPKMIPFFLSLKANKLFYFHATYDSSFSQKGLGLEMENLAHDIIIKNSTLTLATQHLLAWQIKERLNKKAEMLQHPSYASIKPAFFSEDEYVPLPFKRFLITFGDLTRPSKGAKLLSDAVKGTAFNTVFAGKQNNLEGGFHLDRWLSDGELYNLLKRASCTALPYLIPSLFSGCLALSFHFHKPVLAPFTPAFENLIEENKTGWFFTSGDVVSLKETISKIWEGKKKFSPSAIETKEKEMDGNKKTKLKELLERFGEM